MNAVWRLFSVPGTVVLAGSAQKGSCRVLGKQVLRSPPQPSAHSYGGVCVKKFSLVSKTLGGASKIPPALVMGDGLPQ